MYFLLFKWDYYFQYTCTRISKIFQEKTCISCYLNGTIIFSIHVYVLVRSFRKRPCISCYLNGTIIFSIHVHVLVRSFRKRLCISCYLNGTIIFSIHVHVLVISFRKRPCISCYLNGTIIFSIHVYVLVRSFRKRPCISGYLNGTIIFSIHTRISKIFQEKTLYFLRLFIILAHLYGTKCQLWHYLSSVINHRKVFCNLFSMKPTGQIESIYNIHVHVI